MKKRWPNVLGVALASLAAALLLPALGGAEQGGQKGSTRVVCVDYDRGGEAHLELRSKPRKCTFVHRNQKPFGYNTVDLIRLEWKSWGKRRARAKGKSVVNMVGPTPVRVKLSQARSGCGGHRVYTKATFRDPKGGRRTHLPLDACP